MVCGASLDTARAPPRQVGPSGSIFALCTGSTTGACAGRDTSSAAAGAAAPAAWRTRYRAAPSRVPVTCAEGS